MRKVLIIEDDILLREGIRDLLSLNKFEVYTASDGVEGLKLAREVMPDIIICDIMMPRLDGYQLKEIINGDNELSVIPFIYLTAKSEMKSLREGMDLGADDYIIKPFDTSALIKVIEKKIKHYDEIRYKALEQSSADGKKHEKKLAENDVLIINLNSQTPRAIRVGEIKSIEVSGNYSKIYYGKEILSIRKSITSWEEILEENLFLRIHQSIIINMNFIEKLSKWSSNTYLVYISGIEQPFTISQRYVSKIKQKLRL